MLANHTSKKLVRQVFLTSLFMTSCILAEDKETNIGTMAASVSSTFKDIGQMIIGIAFVAGLGFGVAAIFKFKQHKDNPTQVPVGTPVAMLAISAALVFLPGFYNPLGATMGLKSSDGGGFTGSGSSALPDGGGSGGGAAGGDS